MADVMNIVGDTNAKIAGAFTGINTGKWITYGLWGLVIIALVAAIVYFLWIYPKRKQFKKTIVAFEIVGQIFSPAIRDVAKAVKIGTSGFEVLYLKKQKVYRIAYGGKVGKDTYYFFIMPDGYWYNGELSADMKMLDKEGGLISVKTTNPSMRTQYVALEKQIEALHGAKQSWIEKYGQWVAAIAFVLIAGVFFFLIGQEIAKAMGSYASINEQQGKILESLANLAENIKNVNSAGTSGLVPA